jgi:hypothetical protein
MPKDAFPMELCTRIGHLSYTPAGDEICAKRGP